MYSPQETGTFVQGNGAWTGIGLCYLLCPLLVLSSVPCSASCTIAVRFGQISRCSRFLGPTELACEEPDEMRRLLIRGFSRRYCGKLKAAS